MWRRSATTTLLGVSIEIYRRSGRDLVMGHRGNIPLGRFVTYYWDVIGCFVWDVPATSLGRTERRCCDVTTMCFCWVGLVLHTQWLKNFQSGKELPQCINLQKNLNTGSFAWVFCYSCLLHCLFVQEDWELQIYFLLVLQCPTVSPKRKKLFYLHYK